MFPCRCPWQDFALAFVEIDNFAEHLEREGRAWAEEVVSLLSRVLQGAVRTRGAADSPIFHLGGDAFALLLAHSGIAGVCEEVCSAFDAAVHTISDHPTKLSIGVVTNEGRGLTHLTQFIELAGEMLAYAQAQPASCFVVDRRRPPVDE